MSSPAQTNNYYTHSPESTTNNYPGAMYSTTTSNNPYPHDDFLMVNAPTVSHTGDAGYAFVDEPPGCCEQALDYNRLPDACTNEVREERLIQRQQKKKDELDNRNILHRFLERERHLIIACVVLVVCMNFSTGRYVLYPFMIFSTWVHEMCHAMAALLMGGSVSKLQIFKDGSGLAYTSVSGNWKRGFVASGGYPGTAVTGYILLLFRRTTLGPTIGTIGIGALITLSCCIWVRNIWGFVVLLVEGLTFMLLGWKLPAHFLDNLFAFLAATCCLNAVESIQDLFAVGDYYVGGEEVTTSDAHTVAEKWGLHYRFWAIFWLVLSCVLTVIGIIFAFDARENKFLTGRNQQQRKNNALNNDIIDAEVVPYTSQPQQTSHASAVIYGESVEVDPPKQKKKRKWFGFMRKKNQYHDATLY